MALCTSPARAYAFVGQTEGVEVISRELMAGPGWPSDFGTKDMSTVQHWYIHIVLLIGGYTKCLWTECKSLKAVGARQRHFVYMYPSIKSTPWQLPRWSHGASGRSLLNQTMPQCTFAFVALLIRKCVDNIEGECFVFRRFSERLIFSEQLSSMKQ